MGNILCISFHEVIKTVFWNRTTNKNLFIQVSKLNKQNVRQYFLLNVNQTYFFIYIFEVFKIMTQWPSELKCKVMRQLTSDCSKAVNVRCIIEMNGASAFNLFSMFEFTIRFNHFYVKGYKVYWWNSSAALRHMLHHQCWLQVVSSSIRLERVIISFTIQCYSDFIQKIVF